MTPQQIKKQFQDRGESIGQWADQHGFPRPSVYNVLNGRTPCWRGIPHEIAVKLGIKAEPKKLPT